MQPHRTIRWFSRILVLIVALALAACAGQKASGPLIVLDWSGYEQEVFWQEFKQAYPKVQVEHTFFAEDAEAFAKLQSGFVADLVHPNSSWLQLYVDNDLLQPIDTSKLKNWPQIMEPLAKMGQVNGKQYMVPWEWGYDSILVRTDKVPEMPDSWADLWDPRYQGHVSIFDSAESSIVVGALALGYDPYTMTDQQLEEVKQKLIALKPNLLGYWTDYTEINQQVASGEVWVAANTWPDAYVALKAEGIAVDYITPKEGRIGWVYGYCIPKSSKNPALAHAYIDAVISKAAMVEMATQYGYGAANMAANDEIVKTLDPDVVRVMQLNNPDIVKTTVFMKPLTESQREKWTKVWDEVKAAP